MAKVIIHYDDEPVEVVIKKARKADGVLRAELMTKAGGTAGSDLVKMIAFFLYPTCIASVSEPQWVREMSFEDFYNKVDEADIDEWMKVAFEENPHWQKSNELISRAAQ
jgi:hypothetical protein